MMETARGRCDAEEIRLSGIGLSAEIEELKRASAELAER